LAREQNAAGEETLAGQENGSTETWPLLLARIVGLSMILGLASSPTTARVITKREASKWHNQALILPGTIIGNITPILFTKAIFSKKLSFNMGKVFMTNTWTS
jgi:hypothetical protein